VNRKKLATYAFMARFYFGHHLGRLWRSPHRQAEELGRFLANYREDWILPLTPEERSVFPNLQACVSCGLCTSECLLSAPPGNLSGQIRLDPRLLAVAYARSTPAFWAARDLLEKCDACGLCEEVCPTDTPLKRLAKLVADKLGA
jgi:succinate dehydrogenase/fumarate reductase-like Fe-S protein